MTLDPMRRSIPVCLLLAAVLGGCSSEGSMTTPIVAVVAVRDLTATPAPAPTPTPTPRPTPEPTPRPMTKGQAAASYALAAKAFNRKMDALVARYGSTSDGTARRRFQALASKAAGEFVIDLRAIRFPYATTRDAKALMGLTASYMRAAKMASTASDEAVLGLLLSDATKAQAATSRQAAKLRRDLGLRRPPVDKRGRSGRRV